MIHKEGIIMPPRSIGEACGTRFGRVGSLAARLALIGAIGIVWNERAEGVPYYTVTDIGSYESFGAASRSLDDFGFISTVRRSAEMTGAELANLPTFAAGVASPYGPMPPQTQTMQPFQINDSGTVIGTLVTSVYRDGTPDYTEVGYAVRSADGQYSPFVPLAGYSGGATTHLYLSSSNQILIVGDRQDIFDVNTGTTTSIPQLIPPELLQKLSLINVDAIDDRGDLLIDSFIFSTHKTEYYILTPPGLSPPPVPEPSTLLIFAAVGALTVRTAARRKAG
jgi:hypothetical protein